jgi:hypothetical protein
LVIDSPVAPILSFLFGNGTMMRSFLGSPVLLCSYRAFLVLTPLFFLGCGDSHRSGASVTGVVKHKGQIVRGGVLRLISVGDERLSASGLIRGDGAYEVRNAPLGEVKVVVDTESARFGPHRMIKDAPPGAIDESKLPPGPSTDYTPIDRRYADPAESSLRMTVHKGEQQHDIDIP